jgi:ABC-type uncharacterized transport system involved in gliding motility auxiliary subunit
MNWRNRLSYRLTNLIFVLALSLVLGMLAWLGNHYDRVWDWTFDNRSSLSSETIQILDRMQLPLRVTAFVEDNAPLHDRIRQVITRYQQHKSDISLIISNPDLEPDLALAEGISKAGVLVFSYGTQREELRSLDERPIAQALLRLLREKQTWVLMIEGHGEADSFNKETSGLSLWRKELTTAGMQLQPINLLRGMKLPHNTSLLIITTPSHEWPQGELAAVLQYLENGGNLLWLQDPGELQGLEPLARALRIDFVPGTLVDANEDIHKLLGIQNPTIIPVLDYGRHPVSETLKTQTLFPLAQAIEVLPDSKWENTPLLRSLQHSWSENGPLHLQVRFDLSQGDILGPLDLGIALSRKQGEREQRVVVIGDSQFANNTYLGYGANRELLLNMMNWLTEDQGLISLSPRKAPDTQIELSQTQILIIASSLMLVLPALLIMAGMTIWYRRRRR